MSVKITDNFDFLQAQLENNVSLSVRLMLEDIHRISTPLTPYGPSIAKTGYTPGALRSMVNKVMEDPLTGVISWYAPYAWYQERGYTTGPVRNYTTPGTQAWFAKTATKQVLKNMRQYFVQTGVLS